MPNTITDTITELADNKSDIQDALVAKGVTLAAGHGFNKFAADIATITNQYTQADEGKVVSDGALVAQTSTTATVNGTIDTTTNNEVVVNVPNTYTAGDEGKVVNNGQLVAQTAYPTTITENGTYNTTNYNSIAINIPTSNSNIIMCDYSSALDDNYIKYPSYLIIDEERKNIIFFMFFTYTGSSTTKIPTANITLTPQIPLSTIFDGKNVQKVMATYATRLSSGTGNWAYGTTVNPFEFDISQNKILCNSINVYSGLLCYEYLSYE